MPLWLGLSTSDLAALQRATRDTVRPRRTQLRPQPEGARGCQHERQPELGG